MISSTGESLAKKDTTGNISSIFSQSKQGTIHPRFSELKKAIWKDSMTQSWIEVLDALKGKAEQIGSLGPKAGYSIKNPPDYAQTFTL